MQQQYIGVKIIDAEPAPAPTDMGSYKEGDEGYKVTYEDGYISWSPKAVFEAAYRLTSGMTFGLAIETMKKGMPVFRAGWNGKNMFIFYAYTVPGFAPFIAINTGLEVRPWLASQADMLADDWTISSLKNTHALNSLFSG